ncbi:hypothetical protein G8764_01050 [Pseudomaricurvus alcaniphilus]|uniref:hypothetical protein n=1 Tax=Pseudomaricurvus alcaniphilus TaxID=1166482 RepID=UPI00140C1F2C|nr:hypothetical protein [Pseudomaricurvus alcaniphilus]NHN35878.1 hypothetical protein [Pseudomaricurvus alcaniphilus]
MISFGSKKLKSNKSGLGPKSEAAFPARQRLLQLQRFVRAIRIGSRIRYHQEYEEGSSLETLVVGYQVNGHRVFRPGDIRFEADDLGIRVVICEGGQVHDITRIESFALIVPDTSGEERQLDYDSRAQLSRLGPLGPRSRLVLMSSGFASDVEHLKCEAEVYRRSQLQEGVHARLHVVLLTVALGSLEEHEPRKSSRLSTDLCVTVCKNGTDQVMTAWLRDFSEESIRLELEHEADSWPSFGKKDYLLVGLKAAVDKPLRKLRCECVEERGGARIFKVTHISSQGQPIPYQKLDALELKIDLMGLAEE